MLEKIIRNPLINVVMTILLTWFAISMYRGTGADIKAESFEVHFNFNLLPYVIMFLIALSQLILLVVYRKKHKPANFKMLNPELRDDDEAYSWVTDKACRNFYISFYYIFPIGLAIMGLSSFMEKFVPGFPIYVFAAVGIVQYIVYWWNIKKLNRL